MWFSIAPSAVIGVPSCSKVEKNPNTATYSQ